MSDQPVVKYASRTDVGMRRSANQDSLTVRLCGDLEEWQRCGHLFVVADGMGGHSVGDLASRITVETLPQAYFRIEAEDVSDRMRQAVLAANKAVHERGRQNPEFSDMGTTCSALSLSEQGLIIGHVGYSRIYRARHGQIQQLTFDHSLQWEMIRLGRATAATVDLFHPRNVITRCIGPDPNVKVDLEGPFSVAQGDRLILCSDGLSNHMSDSEIGQIATSLPPTEAARLLVNLANCRGGSDNSTVIVIEIDHYPHVEAEVVDPVQTHPDNTPLSVSMIQVPHNGGNYVLLSLSVISVAAGAGSFAFQHPIAGAIALLAAGIFEGIRQLTKLNHKRAPQQHIADSQDGFVLAPGVDRREAAPTEIQEKTPYRSATAILSEYLLDQLSEIQGELVQAARDSGWSVNFEELTQLSRNSIASQQTNKLDKALQFRARSVDLLMKELYQRARAGSK